MKLRTLDAEGGAIPLVRDWTGATALTVLQAEWGLQAPGADSA